MNENTVYDAIVVGTGISGGWAAKELCENGLKTLVFNPNKGDNFVINFCELIYALDKARNLR